MTCLETQKLITPFINDQLEISKLTPFLKHIHQCDDCKEELDVYYTLLTGMKLLDEEKDFSDNFHLDLVNKIQKTEERIKHSKHQTIVKYIFLINVILSVAIFSSIRLGEYVVELEEEKNNHLSLSYYFHKEKTLPLDTIIQTEYIKIIKGRDNYKALINNIR